MLRIASFVSLALVCGVANASADVVVTVNKSTQRLHVAVDGMPRYEWPVSTARWGYNTPNGEYRPERLEKKWYSRKYSWSPMPHSIFFDGGYAIHGSYEVSRLGRPASHGCIRLSPRNAATLFALVKENRSNTRIVVTGNRPSGSYVAGGHRRHRVAREHYHYGGPGVNFEGVFNYAPPSPTPWTMDNQSWYRN
jgi:hypothetical protein